MIHQKIRPIHLERLAYLYLRQSTPQQMLDHKESLRVQLQLKEKLIDLGFKNVTVVDTDLGKSGAGYADREGFTRILHEVYQERVGAVAAWEASRLARSHYEWQNLIRFCQITNTLVIDESGIYDPTNIDDNAMLGIKATMCEYELNMLMKRARAGSLEKAHRGELYTMVPSGYYLTDDGTCEMEADERIQQTVQLVFDKFNEFGSAHQVLLWFCDEGIKFPKVRHYQKRRGIEWELPIYRTILSVLKNPIYAGAYVYGRSTTKTFIRDNKPVKTAHHPLPMEEWTVLLENQHAAYISWDQYLKNQQQLLDNAHHSSWVSKGAAKKGSSLLTGLLMCGVCGRKLNVKYSGHDGKNVRYVCRGNYNSTGKHDKCFTANGSKLDAAVVDQVLKVIGPAAINASLEAEDKLSRTRSEHYQRLELALEQARYVSDRRQRQFNAVDPENRSVLRQIQQQWDEALGDVERLEQELTKENQEHPPLDELQRHKLYELADDLPSLWNSPFTDERTKKRIIRTLIENIVAKAEPETALNHFTIYWVGGVHTEFSLKRPRRGKGVCKTSKEAIELIEELAAITNDSDIARILNRCGLKTASGNSWSKASVSTFRHVNRIRGFSKKAYEASHLLNVYKASDELGVNRDVVNRLIKIGLIQAKQIIKHAPWMIHRSELEKPSVVEAIRCIKQQEKIIDPNQQNLMF